MRAVEDENIVNFRKKMETNEAKEIYKISGWKAEFPNAWIKTKLEIRQFSVKGISKALMEILWGILTYNMQQWEILVWQRQFI